MTGPYTHRLNQDGNNYSCNLIHHEIEKVTKISSTANASTVFKLQQNYPNPFNPETIIEYQISDDSKVKITVFDIVGQKVATLINKEQT